jgi:hypothetical protein
MAKASKGVPQVLDVLEQEVGLVLEDSTLIERFAAGAKLFFKRAGQLEVKAKGNLVEAQRLVRPKTVQDDERLQLAIKAYGADQKEALEHWDIALKVSRFHKRLVAARSRAEDPNEEAVAIATRLHNEYVDAERRRVAQENERLRREAEKRAANDRARELAEMERKAVEAELASEDLSTRELAFVTIYMRTGQARLAAHQAGYKDPEKQGPRLLGLAKILAACDAVKKAEVIREQAAAVKEQPLDVQIDEVKPNLSHAGGHDRTTKAADLFDERLFVEAVIGGRHGIPADTLGALQPKLNEYARSLGDLINRWPGVRLKKTTSLV